MGYYNILKYFIRRLFSFLRSITGKLFVIFVLLFFVLILGVCIDKGVFAATYTEYDYIECSGSQYINTGVNPNTNTSIEIVASSSNFTWSLDGQTLFGSRTGYNSNGFSFWWCFRERFVWEFNTTHEVYENPPFQNEIVNISLSNGVLNISNGTTTKTYTANNSFSSSLPIYLFALNDGGSVARKCLSTKLYSCKIYQNNSLVRDFIPVKDSNNVFCLYDKINDNFYYNLGSGSFTGGSPLSVSPFIENDSSSINNWSFDYLNINSGSVGYVYYDDLLDITSYADLNLKYIYDGITYTQSIPSGFLVDWSDENFTLEIPRTWLLSNVNIQNGKSVDFYLEVKKQNVSDNIYFLGSYTLSLTSAEQEQIQQDNDKALQGQILESQQQTNNKLDNIDNTINDSNIDDITSDTLPSDSTTDITANGVNGIFTSIYNAFCVGNAQDIVFPVPFTDKNITLSANYLSNSLTNANATFVITIIQAFWWYIISRFIIKDVMNKINKIKSGNIEDIETTNIRGDML